MTRPLLSIVVPLVMRLPTMPPAAAPPTVATVRPLPWPT